MDIYNVSNHLKLIQVQIIDQKRHGLESAARYVHVCLNSVKISQYQQIHIEEKYKDMARIYVMHRL